MVDFSLGQITLRKSEKIMKCPEFLFLHTFEANPTVVAQACGTQSSMESPSPSPGAGSRSFK